MKATHRIKKGDRAVMQAGTYTKNGINYVSCIVPFTESEIHGTNRRPMNQFHLQDIRLSNLTKIKIGNAYEDE